MVLLEILPLLVEDGVIHYLAPRGRPSWLARCARTAHPCDQITRLLTRRGSRPVVLHSTSWRYRGGNLVLTYLAVIPERFPPARVPDFQLRGLSTHEIARGSATHAPPTVAIEHVIAHAVRHLAWLSRDDPAVRDALSPGWRAALRAMRPEPFRAIA
jgi:hypothetical protein